MKNLGEFFVDELHDVEWVVEIFDKLVLPNEDKQLLLGFVRQQSKVVNVDTVPRKGY